MSEIWKTIEGFSNYQVSNYGNVRNSKTWRILKKHIHNGRRYRCYRVCLSVNGVTKNKRVGRLVAAAFVKNRDIINKTQVDHLDGDSFNDNATNLEWVTHKENQRRRVKR